MIADHDLKTHRFNRNKLQKLPGVSPWNSRVAPYARRSENNYSDIFYEVWE